MSVLQEYEKIRKMLGDKEWANINWFLLNNDQYTLDDVLYKKANYTVYEEWLDSHPLPANMDIETLSKIGWYLAENKMIFDGTDEMLEKLSRETSNNEYECGGAKSKGDDVEL